jgi:hypothetical protein
MKNNLKRNEEGEKQRRLEGLQYWTPGRQQKSNDNSENLLVNCVFIYAYDNNCLYWMENKLFLFYFIYL